MDRRRIALDIAIVVGFCLFLLGISIFYRMFFAPGHGDFTVCSSGVSTSCWGDASGPIFMFLILFGGAALFGIGAFHRKTTNLAFWESVLLGYIVSLFFDLVILPAGLLPLLPLNGGGILILTLFIMSLCGIIVSAFKYIQTSNGGTEKRTSPILPLLTSPRRKKIYILIVIAGLMFATSLYLAPSIVYGGFHSCYVAPGQLSFQISNYIELLGPPLFSQNYEQFLLLPGQSAFVQYIWNSTIYGNNLTAWFSGPINPSNYNHTFLSRVNGVTGWGEDLPLNQTGVSMIFQNLTYQGIHFAKFLYKISIGNSAPAATYYLYGGAGCAKGLLMTVGSLPYWGPLWYGEIQPMGFISNVVISLLGSSVLITILQIRYSNSEKDDQEAALRSDQLTPR